MEVLETRGIRPRHSCRPAEPMGKQPDPIDKGWSWRAGFV